MKRDLELLYEIGALRLMPRQWQRFHLQHAQNLAEHHFRVAWIALIIANREKKGDIAKILKMAMAHDIAESRTGDVDYLSRQYVKQHDSKASKDILADTSLEREFGQLLAEYEERKTIEAKIVKDADNLDVDMELREQAYIGNRLEELWSKNRKKVAQTKLYTEAAKQLSREIADSNPHDWHVLSPGNRINGGDWKK